MENNINKLKEEYLNNLNNNINNNKTLNNKIILIEILLKNNLNRDLIPLEGAVLYFNKINKLNINKIIFNKKIISIKNSLDTLISNYNNFNKINNDDLLNKYKLINNNNNYKLINK